ncbi:MULTISPECIES: oligosaccharide MFS transporter [Furfurilactobacillus]|uniref:Na+ melibiose symporter related transporter n=2 Tax=Furfurilactobacillus TaxID=2767882 RepID=A0A0R1RFM9_9LACO|nr:MULTISPECIES: oligosaccharide MFS transporter [Furfurilactobacillus]KRL54052.1 Na+ melibiose symporter related transporter [Furfurilactobacillus rossiae DSM 15814]MCF6166179.1 oligosaccharide MFS transporter [Furfurilactobacillus rossiae]MYV17027.1 MFS transporter [Furfurilactobacillus milii]QFR67449.1 MFS transporter [Furfurilactobacillus rossiae]QLE60395.1 Lactose permease [Furfurilactobacillus rossiae]
MQKTESKHFWGFPFSHFSYFFIWATVYGYLTLWMEQVGHLNGTESGAVFSMMAGISLIFQPIFGVVSDKLLFKKNLVILISVVAIFIGPYFQWVFLPLLHINSFLVAIVTGTFLSFVLNGGVSVIEQYVQRASLANKFEYAHSRVGGSVAGVVASLIAGRLFLWSPDSIFWACTVAAIILTGLLLFSDKIDMDNASAAGDTSNSLDMKTVMSVFKIKNLWVLAIFYMGASAIFDVFDQQFIIFFKTFFHTAAQGTLVYSYMTSGQTAIEFLLMFPMPWIINKIGSKNGLIIYGFITCIRILGSALSPTWGWVVFFRLLAGLEMPLLLTSIMKYIAGAFDIRLYATVYALASNFAKQISVFIFSSVAGKLYDVIGYQHTYIWMGVLVFVITLFAAFFLKKEDKVQAGEVEAPKDTPTPANDSDN